MPDVRGIRAKDFLGQAIEIAADAFQHVGGMTDDHFRNDDQAPGLPLAPTTPNSFQHIAEGFHMLETHHQEARPRQDEAERCQRP